MKRFVLALLALMPMCVNAVDFRGAQFISVAKLNEFSRTADELRSKPITPEIDWDELVVSWNIAASADNGVEVTVELPGGKSEPFATWRSSANRFSPKSGGLVDTDTLKLPTPDRATVTVRLRFVDGAKPEDFKFLGLAFRNSKVHPEPLEPNRRAWGRTVDVAPRSQLDYPEGAKIWCSPTSTSMILDYWSKKLNRPEMSMTVPEVAHSVHDVVYKGTGNWPFNTAFAGSFTGMRGYVSRLTDVSELEDWIASGIPVATSVSYNRLKGLNKNGSGHLIVCVGFAENGDIIVNDPGTRLSNVRRTFGRDIFRQAWAESGNTVYIIYPETAAIPPARHGHWEAR